METLGRYIFLETLLETQFFQIFLETHLENIRGFWIVLWIGRLFLETLLGIAWRHCITLWNPGKFDKDI